MTKLDKKTNTIKIYRFINIPKYSLSPQNKNLSVIDEGQDYILPNNFSIVISTDGYSFIQDKFNRFYTLEDCQGNPVLTAPGVYVVLEKAENEIDKKGKNNKIEKIKDKLCNLAVRLTEVDRKQEILSNQQLTIRLSITKVKKEIECLTK